MPGKIRPLRRPTSYVRIWGQAGIIRRNEPMAPFCFPLCLGLVLEWPKSATVPQTGLQPAGRSDGLFELQLVRERSRAPKFGA
jgi:hypothetical protein